jgi:hypothetical protein
MADTWESIALPALRWIAEHESLGAGNVGDIADELGADPVALVNELDRLSDGGYLAGEVGKTATGGNPRPWFLHPLRLGIPGARAVGMWPSGDAAGVLLDVLKAAEDAAPDPEERGRIAKARDALSSIGMSVLTELAVSYTKRMAGLP